MIKKKKATGEVPILLDSVELGEFRGSAAELKEAIAAVTKHHTKTGKVKSTKKTK